MFPNTRPIISSHNLERLCQSAAECGVGHFGCELLSGNTMCVSDNRISNFDLYGIYSALNGSYAGVANEILTVISSVVGLIRSRKTIDEEQIKA